MKNYIVGSLSDGEKTTAARLYTLIYTLVDNNEMTGPAPKGTQVRDFVKNWRRKNPKDSMAPLIALCDGRLYDQQDPATLLDIEMVILCDSQPNSQPGDTELVSHFGDGSTSYPLRVGMTCLRMMKSYIDVKNRPNCISILHIDNTHNRAINGYVVFAFGYSDICGHYYPMVYFCTLQKRAIDIGWCIQYIQRVFMGRSQRLCHGTAAYNCANVLVHVTKNVWKHSQEKKVHANDTRSVFTDLYDMHYASEQEYPTVKEQVIRNGEIFHVDLQCVSLPTMSGELAPLLALASILDPWRLRYN
ncbi:hypothetical protein GQ600_12624 [Phytophthora cactorum]|nr:hypothetical protein GQ600_12624 [Phytophthora cactorum]